jgi:uncharacterized RDD family membrane protein YckC
VSANYDPASASKAAPPGYQFAGAGIRLGAFIIDGLVITAVIAVLFVVPAAVGVPESVFAYLDRPGLGPGAVMYVVTSAVMFAWYGGWQAGVGGTPGMLLLKLRVRGPTGEGNPSLVAAVIRNAPVILGSFGVLTGNEAVDGLLLLVTIGVCVAIGITISNSATRQGFHDRLAGGTYVVRRMPVPSPTQ